MLFNELKKELKEKFSF